MHPPYEAECRPRPSWGCELGTTPGTIGGSGGTGLTGYNILYFGRNLKNEDPLMLRQINVQSGPKVGLHCVTVSKKGFQWLTINTAATILIYLVICENISLCPALTK